MFIAVVATVMRVSTKNTNPGRPNNAFFSDN